MLYHDVFEPSTYLCLSLGAVLAYYSPDGDSGGTNPVAGFVSFCGQFTVSLGAGSRFSWGFCTHNEDHSIVHLIPLMKTHRHLSLI